MKVTIFHSIARECASGSSPLMDVGTLPRSPSPTSAATGQDTRLSGRSS